MMCTVWPETQVVNARKVLSLLAQNQWLIKMKYELSIHVCKETAANEKLSKEYRYVHASQVNYGTVCPKPSDCNKITISRDVTSMNLFIFKFIKTKIM